MNKPVVVVLCLAAAGLAGLLRADGASYTSVHGFPLDDPNLGGKGACSYCHATHNALGGPGTPLWNQQLKAKPYTIYQSTTLQAKPGQPTGSTKLCLSCHDGTIAPAASGAPGDPPLSAAARALLIGELSVGTDLSDDHPVSFTFGPEIAAADPQVKNPSILAGGPVKLDKNQEMQCTSCHDAHKDTMQHFLVKDNRQAALCLTCHQPTGWATSVHATSPVTNPANTEYPVISDAGCGSCHEQHHAGSHARLLIYQEEERNCLSCHNGSVARKRIDTELNKSSAHHLSSYTGVHDPKEDPLRALKHVECEDCHNPHALKSGTVGSLPGSIASVSGLNASGVPVASASNEYEICFKCHADNPNRPASRISRQITQTNTRLEFNSANPSFHPVIRAGASANVPSLIAPLSTSSVIKCTDCHTSDSATVRGPHGSAFSPLLVKNYSTTYPTSESPSAYALCYGCHSRGSILGNQSFPQHNKHIAGEQAPCSVCHDAHGISITQGTSANHSRLINFDTSVVSLNSSGQREYSGGGCYLKCHGKDHNGGSGD